jgi:hypothetical protein
MSIDRHAWLAVWAGLASGCGGEVDGSSTVVTEDGKPHVIADVYGASSSHTDGPLGDWTLGELDVAADSNITLLHFLPDGQLVVTSIDETKVYDDIHGDRFVPTVAEIWGGPKGARWKCEIANRWRMIDSQRIGILFTCDDRLGREAVFRIDASGAIFPPPTTRNSDRRYPLTLEMTGGDRGPMGDTPGSQIYGFELAGATD